MSFGDQGVYDDVHYKYSQELYPNDFALSSSLPDYDQARFHRPQSSFYPFIESSQQHLQLSFHQSVPTTEYSYEQNYAPTYPCSASYPPPRLTPPALHRPQSQQFPSTGDTLVTNAAHRLPLAGSLDPSTGIFYRTPEHPRLRTAQACEKCRTRKAKCSGEHPSCKRCLTRGLICQYAKEGRVRGPNKPKIKTQSSNSSSSSTGTNISSSKGSQSTNSAPSNNSSSKDGLALRRFTSTPLSTSPSPTPPGVSEASLHTSSSPSDKSSSPSSLLTSPLSPNSDSTESTSPLDLFTQSARELGEHRSARSRPSNLQLQSSMSTSQERQLLTRPSTGIPNVHGYPITPSHMLDMQPHSTSSSPSLQAAPKTAMASLRGSTPNLDRFDSVIVSPSSSLSNQSQFTMSQSHLSPLQVGIDQNDCSQRDPSPLSISPSPQSSTGIDVVPSHFELSSYSTAGMDDQPRMTSGMGMDSHQLHDMYSHGGLRGLNHSQHLSALHQLYPEPYNQNISLSMLSSMNVNTPRDGNISPYPELEL